MTELVLYTFGSFVFYVTLSWYSRNNFLETVLKVLAYQFIFGVDKWAFSLVEDMVHRRMKRGQFKTLFLGSRDETIYRFEMMVHITIPITMTFIIQGIYSTSWAIVCVGVISMALWCLDFSKYFVKKSTNSKE